MYTGSRPDGLADDELAEHGIAHGAVVVVGGLIGERQIRRREQADVEVGGQRGTAASPNERICCVGELPDKVGAVASSLSINPRWLDT